MVVFLVLQVLFIFYGPVTIKTELRNHRVQVMTPSAFSGPFFLLLGHILKLKVTFAIIFILNFSMKKNANFYCHVIENVLEILHKKKNTKYYLCTE